MDHLTGIGNGGGGGGGGTEIRLNYPTGTANHLENLDHNNRTCWQFLCSILKSWLLLFGLLAYQSACFVAFLSLAIGLGTSFSFLSEVILGSPLSTTTTSIITLVVLAFCGEIHLVSQSVSRFGQWIREQKKKWPIALGFMPVLIYILLYLIAIVQLCYRYLLVHKIKSWWGSTSAEYVWNIEYWKPFDASKTYSADAAAGSSSAAAADDDGQVDSITMNRETFVFLLSISYMTYFAARASDWAVYRCRHFEFIVHAKLGTCCTFLMFYIVQVATLVLYLLPVIFVCLLCRFTMLSPTIIFFFAVLSAAMIGISGVDIETKKPFPNLPQAPPRYDFENHIFARSFLLTYGLHPIIVIPYFFPNTSPAAAAAAATGGDAHRSKYYYENFLNDELKFFIYTLCVCSAVIQAVKVMVNVMYSRDLIFNEPPVRRRVVRPSSAGDGPGEPLQVLDGRPTSRLEAPEGQVLNMNDGETVVLFEHGGGTGFSYEEQFQIEQDAINNNDRWRRVMAAEKLNQMPAPPGAPTSVSGTALSGSMFDCSSTSLEFAPAAWSTSSMALPGPSSSSLPAFASLPSASLPLFPAVASESGHTLEEFCRQFSAPDVAFPEFFKYARIVGSQLRLDKEESFASVHNTDSSQIMLSPIGSTDSQLLLPLHDQRDEDPEPVSTESSDSSESEDHLWDIEHPMALAGVQSFQANGDGVTNYGLGLGNNGNILQSISTIITNIEVAIAGLNAEAELIGAELYGEGALAQIPPTTDDPNYSSDGSTSIEDANATTIFEVEVEPPAYEEACFTTCPAPAPLPDIDTGERYSDSDNDGPVEAAEPREEKPPPSSELETTEATGEQMPESKSESNSSLHGESPPLVTVAIDEVEIITPATPADEPSAATQDNPIFAVNNNNNDEILNNNEVVPIPMEAEDKPFSKQEIPTQGSQDGSNEAHFLTSDLVD